MLRHLEKTFEQPEFRPGMDEVVSFLGTTVSTVTPDGLRRIAALFPRQGPRRPRPTTSPSSPTPTWVAG